MMATFDVALVARDARAAEQAIGLAGGRVAAACACDAAAGVLDSAPAAAVLAVDLRAEAGEPGRFPDFARNERVGEEPQERVDLADALTDLVAEAAARGVAVVVALEEAQIELVAGALFAGPVQLLCAPTPAEWVVALSLAARGTRSAPVVREGERERIVAVTQEMARLAQLLTTLVEGEDGAAVDAVADRRRGFGAQPGEIAIDPAEIRAVLRARRLRDRHLGAGLFEDPAWDMLLDLYAAALEATRVSVSSLCIAAAVAPTTALRWIARLADAGLVEREADPRDRRRVHVALTTEARARMANYAAATARAGLPFV